LCVFFTGLFAPTFNTGPKRSEPNLLAVFSTYYLLTLISVIAALVILCLPLRKQRLVMKTQLILILAGCFIVQYWNGVRIIVTSGSRAYLFKQSAIETANNKVTALQYTFFHWDLHHGQCLFGLIVAYNLYIKKRLIC
jgi:glycine betaine transporter